MGAAYWRSLFFVPPATSPPDSPLPLLRVYFYIPVSSRRIASDGYTDTQPRSMQFCGDLLLFSFIADTHVYNIALRNEV